MIVLSDQLETVVHVNPLVTTTMAEATEHSSISVAAYQVVNGMWQRVRSTSMVDSGKGVRFAATTMSTSSSVNPTAAVRFTLEERQAYWYTPADWSRIKTERAPILLGLVAGRFRETEHMSSRGLEHKTPDAAMKRKQRKMVAWAAVMEEQKRQKKLGIVDNEAISQAYIAANKGCVEAAHKTGQKDEESVKLLHAAVVGTKTDLTWLDTQRKTVISMFFGGGSRNVQ